VSSANRLSQYRFFSGTQLALICVAALGAAALLCWLFFDTRLVLWVGGPTDIPDWDDGRLIQGMRFLGKAIVTIWLLLLWAWIANHPRALLTALLALVLTIPTVLPLKILITRYRPNHALPALASDSLAEIPRFYDRSSFPSGDTATAFAVAAALTPFVAPPWAAALLVLAGSVGLLRVDSLAHYPSDVCVGALLGILAGWLAWKITLRWPLPPWLRFDAWWRKLLPPILVLIFILCALRSRHDALVAFLRLYWPLLLACVLLAKAVPWLKRLRPQI
jgi:membrane-associated phospholipid phosphatase